MTGNHPAHLLSLPLAIHFCCPRTRCLLCRFTRRSDLLYPGPKMGTIWSLALLLWNDRWQLTQYVYITSSVSICTHTACRNLVYLRYRWKRRSHDHSPGQAHHNCTGTPLGPMMFSFHSLHTPSLLRCIYLLVCTRDVDLGIGVYINVACCRGKANDGEKREELKSHFGCCSQTVKLAVAMLFFQDNVDVRTKYLLRSVDQATGYAC